MTFILGIDPGNKGALAFLDPENGVMRVTDMDTFTYETTKTRTKIDPYGITREIGAQPVSHGYIEEIASSPQMGVVSAFNFGEGFGILKGVTAALSVPVTLVKPAKWKRELKVPADKRAAVQRASQLFPNLAHLFKGPRGGLFDGRAEAVLIAFYGAIELGRTPQVPVRLLETVDGL